MKLYLLQQSGSNSFLVADQEKNQKYKVNIGPQVLYLSHLFISLTTTCLQTCSCNKGPGCLHILFIMLRVFGIPENDIRLTARELKEFEIEALFRAHEERKKTRVLRSRLENSFFSDVVLIHLSPGLSLWSNWRLALEEGMLLRRTVTVQSASTT